MKKNDFKKLSALDSFKLILDEQAPFGNPVCTNPSCDNYLKHLPGKTIWAGKYENKTIGKFQQKYKCVDCGTKFFLHPYGFEVESDFTNQQLFEDLKLNWAKYIPRDKIARDIGEILPEKKGYKISEKTMRKFLRQTEVHYRHQIRESFFANEVADIKVREIPFEISKSKNASIFLFFNADLRIVNFAVIPDRQAQRIRFLKIMLKSYKGLLLNKSQKAPALFISSPNSYPFGQAIEIKCDNDFQALLFPKKWLYQSKSLGRLKAKLSIFVLVYNNHMRAKKKKALS